MEHNQKKNISGIAKLLCENRWTYNSKKSVERQILDSSARENFIAMLTIEVLSILSGQNGNLRVGAAEILGAITPPPLKGKVITELKKHLVDEFTRDYVYEGFQGDEEDSRTVASCARHSIWKLT